MSEVTNWRAVKLPHDYNDGTTHRWAVMADGHDIGGNKLTIEISDWLTKDTAHLVAAAPDLYAALREVTEVYWGVDNDDNGDGFKPPPKCIVQARAALARARGEKP